MDMIDAELVRIKAAILQMDMSEKPRAELYAAQQALGWVRSFGQAAKSPYDMIRDIYYNHPALHDGVTVGKPRPDIEEWPYEVILSTINGDKTMGYAQTPVGGARIINEIICRGQSEPMYILHRASGRMVAADGSYYTLEV